MEVVHVFHVHISVHQTQVEPNVYVINGTTRFVLPQSIMCVIQPVVPCVCHAHVPQDKQLLVGVLTLKIACVRHAQVVMLVFTDQLHVI